MASYFSIPLQAQPQTFTINLSGTTYTFVLNYRNTTMGGWVLDINDVNNNPIVQGLPLITGANLLAKYTYLGFTGALWVQTADNPDAVPTFQNLGTDGLLYYVTNP
jgi:predicted Zn-dependent protease with MMP-like domain